MKNLKFKLSLGHSYVSIISTYLTKNNKQKSFLDYFKKKSCADNDHSDDDDNDGNIDISFIHVN